MIQVRGKWTPQVNYNKLSDGVLYLLAQKGSYLKGNEVRFIRTHFEMTLQGFGKRFCVTHVAVLSWENKKNSPTKMGWATEKDIRLFILSRLKSKSQAIVNLYAKLEKLPPLKNEAIEVNLQEIAA